jgi:hypothetical protein
VAFFIWLQRALVARAIDIIGTAFLPSRRFASIEITAAGTIRIQYLLLPVATEVGPVLDVSSPGQTSDT